MHPQYYIAGREGKSLVKVNRRGQITIPADVRARSGLVPGTEIVIVDEGAGRIVIHDKHRGKKLVAQLRRAAKAHPIRMTTEEIMKLTRGDD
jgi:AbrB family looped-hinge helix DNA binding protein